MLSPLWQDYLNLLSKDEARNYTESYESRTMEALKKLFLMNNFPEALIHQNKFHMDYKVKC